MTRHCRPRPRSPRLEHLEERQLLTGPWMGGPIAAEPAPLAHEAQEAPAVRLMVRDSYLSGIPVLVRVQLEDSEGHVNRQLWDATVTLAQRQSGGHAVHKAS